MELKIKEKKKVDWTHSSLAIELTAFAAIFL